MMRNFISFTAKPSFISFSLIIDFLKCFFSRIPYKYKKSFLFNFRDISIVLFEESFGFFKGFWVQLRWLDYFECCSDQINHASNFICCCIFFELFVEYFFKKHKNSIKMGLLEPEILNLQQNIQKKINVSESGMKYALLKKRFGIKNFSILMNIFQVDNLSFLSIIFIDSISRQHFFKFDENGWLSNTLPANTNRLIISSNFYYFYI